MASENSQHGLKNVKRPLSGNCEQMGDVTSTKSLGSVRTENGTQTKG